MSRIRQVIGLMGTFALCAAVAVAVSMAADSAVSAKSERLLIQEGTGNLKKITKSPAHHGGLKALAKLAHHVMGFAHMPETEDTTAKKAALHAAAAKALAHPALPAAHPAGKVAAAHKRLSKLALSKLQDEGSEEGDVADAGEGAEDASAAPEGSEASSNNSTAAAGEQAEAAGGDDDDAPDDRYDRQAHPGWDGKDWDTSDWVVWTVTGPVFTMTAAMFIFYTYGWQWGLATLLVLVGVDMFGFYFNV